MLFCILTRIVWEFRASTWYVSAFYFIHFSRGVVELIMDLIAFL